MPRQSFNVFLYISMNRLLNKDSSYCNLRHHGAYVLICIEISIIKVRWCHGGITPLQWRHYGRDSVSNRQTHHCLLNGLFRCRSKKTSKLRVNGLCEGNSPMTSEFPTHMASNAENVSIWWRHHVYFYDGYLCAWKYVLDIEMDTRHLSLGRNPPYCTAFGWTYRQDEFTYTNMIIPLNQILKIFIWALLTVDIQ